MSFHGGEIATPNIDRIAAEGVLIERFYSAPVCSPTRAGLMTGRYPIRFGLMRAVIAPWRDYGLDTSEVALPEVLARAGYEHRGIFGKWHLGHFDRKYHPLRRGFTEFVGHNTAVDYFTKEREGERDWSHDYESVDEEGYVTDLLTEHAVGFIDRHAGSEAPFFLYVPFSAPHYEDLDALEPPRGWEESTAGRPLAADDRRRDGSRIHAAMVHALDQCVGRVLDALDDHGIADNTLVLFFSDNGGSVGIGDTGPYRGAKGSVFEGGTRVAAAARWPAGNISGGGRIEAPVSYIDVLPTLMGIAGLDDHGGKPLDGRDVGDVLTGEAEAGPERDLYSFIAQLDPEREQVSVTEAEWKLVVVGPPLVREGAVDASRTMLFRLAGDPLEELDVAADHPDLVARLVEKAADFRALQPPNPVAPFFAGRDDYLVWHYHEKGKRYADPLLWGPGGEGGTHEGQYGPDLFVDFLLDRIERRDDAGEAVPVERTWVHGFIIYTASGHMAVHLVRPDRQAFAGPRPTAEEAASAMRTYISYFGPYTIHADDGYIVHHRSGCWFPNCMDTDAQRFYEFGERTLTLQPPAREVDGNMVQDSFVWEQIGE